jgi:Bacterial regulatory proteins, luxR family
VQFWPQPLGFPTFAAATLAPQRTINRSQESEGRMRIYCERMGVLGPVYHLLGLGLSDIEIAKRLHVSELTVQNCCVWLMHRVGAHSRADLAADAAPAAFHNPGHF